MVRTARNRRYPAQQDSSPRATSSTPAGSWYAVGSIENLHLPPSLHRLVHRHFVGVLEIAADRDAHGDAGDADAERLEQTRQVDRRRLALDVRIGREDHFLDGAALDAREQPLDLQLVWADALKRRDRAHEDVVAPLE